MKSVDEPMYSGLPIDKSGMNVLLQRGAVVLVKYKKGCNMAPYRLIK